MSTLIMPKQTARLDVFYYSLRIYYDAFKECEKEEDIWVTNSDYKKIIVKYVPSLGANEAYLVKQSELTRYFGLVFHDYENHRAKITDRGIKFYEAYLHSEGTDEQQLDLLAESIFNDTFGRNNTAIEKSDSDIDPPKLFIKALYDKEIAKLTIGDFAYLLYLVHNKKISYEDSKKQLGLDKNKREVPTKVVNKYKDVKFISFFKNFGGIVDCLKNEYRLSDSFKNKYAKELEKLSIYNRQPDYVFSLKEDFEENENEQEVIVTSLPYDINSDILKKWNEREPIEQQTTKGIRYKTNPRLAKTSLKLAKFKCLFDQEHETFISKFGDQYMEAHHLIPMSAQKDFHINIDRLENIVCLCPTCHSAIHLGNNDVRCERLKKIYEMYAKKLKESGIEISFQDLFERYYK